MSVETGISPNELIEAPDGMLEAMVDVLQQRAKQLEKAQKRAKR